MEEGKDYYIQAATADEMQDWIVAIRAAKVKNAKDNFSISVC
jgi:hypothetical protein